MFDRYELSGGNHTHTHSVTEKRAPTDESVRLLKEMEDAARKKVEQSIRLESNDFKCVVHVYEDFMNNQKIAVARFDLAGKAMEAEFRQHGYEKDPQAMKLATGLMEAISKKIAYECLNELATALHMRL